MSNNNSHRNTLLSFCSNRNLCQCFKLHLTWPYFTLSEQYETDIRTYGSIYTYIEKIDLKSISEDLPRWYYIIGKYRHMFISHKNYYSYFDIVSYKDLPNICKTLLSENINLLQTKQNCSLEEAQRWSLLTAIVVSWKDAYSSLKANVEREPLSHKYTLTEAVFILHLTPKSEIIGSFINIFQGNKYENEEMLFYVKCLTGALAFILKHEKKIRDDFEFEILTSDTSKSSFLRNGKKLMEAYKSKNIFLDMI